MARSTDDGGPNHLAMISCWHTSYLIVVVRIFPDDSVTNVNVYATKMLIYSALFCG